MILFLIALQMIPIDKELRNKPAPSGNKNKIKVKALSQFFYKECYDCHSFQTKWPWYSNVAPVSLIIQNEVHNGRKAMNFDQWEKYSKLKQFQYLEKILRKIEKNEMPPTLYKISHPSKKISDEKISALKNFIESKKNEYPLNRGWNIYE